MDITATLFGQMIAFAVFVWFCMKIVWPPITARLAERQKRIADGLEAATRAEKDLEMAQARASKQLRDARSQAAGIIDQANKRAAQIVEEAKEQAREEGKRLIAGAHAEIEQEVNQAREQLRRQVAGIAIVGAEKILEATVDEGAHRQLLDKLAAEL